MSDPKSMNEQCVNPSCDEQADWLCTLHYPEGDAEAALCEEHSEPAEGILTRDEKL